MTVIIGTNVTAPVVPGDTVDVFPSHEAEWGKGGYRTVDNIAARDAITVQRRTEGMLVNVISDSKVYRLEGGIANINWAVFAAGGGLSDPNAVQHTAGENLSGQQIVYLDSSNEAKLADHTVNAQARNILGVTIGAATTGNPVGVRLFGEVSEVSWTWTPQGQIYLNGVGIISQTPPGTGALCLLGIAETATQVFFRISRPILRS